MRGHWEDADSMGLAPNQQQQQPIAEEQEHPLHSATTPAWGIADRIVKEEPTEDKNNDSGVSPGHYTSNSASPASGRSSSTVNCSLSPGSTHSQDSNTMQCSGFDYSPQGIFKGCTSPTEFAQRDQQNEQAMDVASNDSKPAGEEAEYGQDTLQCPICAFSTTNKMKFTEHVSGHCSTKCDTSDFMKAVLGQLAAPGTLQEENDRSSPGQGDRSEHESEEPEEPGLRIPRVNAQGKVKTFRCKQCDFSAITKLDFWEHSRGHIKAEKLLTCPKCPFVTEYKHHLEYHLRNHIGSKPFKCDKCSYSCVNKSMLNSHLKSHSNVYQYRCANCSYATKYCHSLKLHLRKYSHQPAMVLNADGSPNPLPIIDVYGTRRGPKQKPLKNQEDNSQGSNMLTNNNVQPTLAPNQMALPAQMSPVGHHFELNSLNNTANTINDANVSSGNSGMNNVSEMNGMNGINGINGISGINGIGGMNGLSNINGMHNMNGLNGMNGFPGMAGINNASGIAAVNGMSPNQPAIVSFAYNPIFSGFPLANNFGAYDESADKNLAHIKSSMIMEYVKAVGAQRLPEDMIPQDLALNGLAMNGAKLSDGFPSATGTAQATMESAETSNPTKTPSPVMFDKFNESTELKALDLSKPDLTSNNNNGSNIQAEQQKQANSSPRATGTSRRKGRAFKLERRVQEDESGDENNVAGETSEANVEQPSASSSPSCSSPDSKEEEDKRNFGGVGMSNEFTCQYCEIAFGNVVMYTVHMGYHGYKDPYTCNMCGHQCTDKVSFFLHIARSKHS